VSPYNYNSSNELTSTPSGSYTYDNNGNRKSDSTGAQYTWDFENHLTQVVLPSSGGTVNFKYDPFGRRIQKAFSQNSTTTTTDYLYDRSDVLETVNPNGTVLARHVDGPSIDEPLSELVSGVTSYYEQDGLGSVSSLSNSSGALANTYTYDSYGKLTASTGTIANPFQYTGREFDPETGAYYYRARYLDPPTGRFLSEDPIGFGGGVNFYPYVLNNPVTLRDPAGKNAGVIAIPASEWVGGALCFGSGVCETVIVVGGVAVAVAATGYVIYNYFDNSDASDGAQSNSEPSSCKRDKRDPCEGLRLQLAAHQAKLAAYASNPYANDNRSILGQGYDDSIIAGRIKHLVHEIQELQKQLEECERLNGSQ
jgi:RHS repeat-associated protein